MSWKFTRPGTYALLTVVDRRGPRLALDADVQPAASTLDVSGPNSSGARFRLTPEAAQAGVHALAVASSRYDHGKLQAFLRGWIYQDQRLRDLAWPAVVRQNSVRLGAD